MSASITPTLRPWRANAAARFAVIEDLPTPPFPEVTAMTRVRESGRANRISRSGRPPLSFSRRAFFCSSFMTSMVTLTSVTPSRALRVLFTSSEIVVRRGHPAVVSKIVTETVEPSILMASTILRSVIGRRISGSITVDRASRTFCEVKVMVSIL